MKHIDPMLATMLKRMVDYPTRDNVLPKYQIVLQQINNILEEMTQHKDFTCAHQLFDQLLEIQTALSVLVFKEKIDEYSRINKFVRDFDRADDDRERKYLFNKIKNNQLRY